MSQRLMVWLLSLAAVLSLTAAARARDSRKRAELLQPSFLSDQQLPSRNVRQSKFWSGSRYGRAVGLHESQPRLEIEPRSDRFFMGSRYGKRTVTWLEAAEAWRPGWLRALRCPYTATGLQQLLLCARLFRNTVIEGNQPHPDSLPPLLTHTT